MNLQRDLNPKNFYKHIIKIQNTPVCFFDYTPRISSLVHFNESRFKPILQIPVVFKSKKKLILLKKDEVLNNQKNSDFKFHKVLFECQGLELMRLNNVYDALKILTKFKIKNIKVQEFILKNIFQEDFQWKVTDIDDYMNGNNFGENEFIWNF